MSPELIEQPEAESAPLEAPREDGEGRPQTSASSVEQSSRAESAAVAAGRAEASPSESKAAALRRAQDGGTELVEGAAEEKRSRKRPRAAASGAGGKRERILRAAAELFAANDYHRVLIDEVARRAEVGKGTVYRHFQTKEDLFVAVLSYAVDLATDRLRAKIERARDPVQQLRVACKQALRFFRENDHLFHVLNQEKSLRCAKGRDDLNEKRKGLRHFVEDILLDGRETGVFAAGDAAFASTILWGMIRTALRNSPRDAPLDEVSGQIVELFTKGIIRRGDAGP